MSVAEIMREIDILPAPERWRVLEHARHTLEPDAPRKRRRVLLPEFVKMMQTPYRGSLQEDLDAVRGDT